MKKVPLPLIFALIGGLAIGFFAGMEYKSYQIRQAFEQVGSPQNASESKTVIEQAEEQGYKTIEKNAGEEIALASIKFKVNKTEEKQTITGGFSSPKTASSGAKFVIVDLSVTNLTDAQFTFFPDDGFRLVDSNRREFQTYPDTIGNISDYLNSRELAPSIVQTGVIVYEVPSDAMSYSLVVGKSGTEEIYQVKLK